MRRALWILAWIGVAVWSLLAWGAYGLFDLFGDMAVRNADIVTGHPETVEWLSWALVTLRSLGLVAIILVWGIVSLLILAVPAVLGLILGRPETALVSRTGARGSQAPASGMSPRHPVPIIRRAASSGANTAARNSTGGSI